MELRRRESLPLTLRHGRDLASAPCHRCRAQPITCLAKSCDYPSRPARQRQKNWASLHGLPPVFWWNPGLLQEDHPDVVANHNCGPWHIICLQEGSGFAIHPSLQRRFHVADARHRAVLINKDTVDEDTVNTLPCVEEGVFILTGDINKNAQKKKIKRTSPLKAAFFHTTVPWPSHGTSPLWRPDGAE